MNANFNFDDFYKIATKIFDPLTNLLNTVKVNGTSLIAILVTVLLVSLILRFVIGAPTFGLSGFSQEKSYKQRQEDNAARRDYYKQGSQYYKNGSQYYRNKNSKSGRRKG